MILADKDSDMETFVLDIDNEPNIRFSGELIASASSSDNSASGSYSPGNKMGDAPFLVKYFVNFQ